MTKGFLPVCRQDMIDKQIEQMDFVYVTGDAYVDHPSFGHAISSRILDAHGYKVGIISQPDWKAVIWILWLIIIMYPERDARRMRIHRVELWGNVPIMPR